MELKRRCCRRCCCFSSHLLPLRNLFSFSGVFVRRSFSLSLSFSLYASITRLSFLSAIHPVSFQSGLSPRPFFVYFLLIRAFLSSSLSWRFTYFLCTAADTVTFFFFIYPPQQPNFDESSRCLPPLIPLGSFCIRLTPFCPFHPLTSNGKSL